MITHIIAYTERNEIPGRIRINHRFGLEREGTASVGCEGIGGRAAPSDWARSKEMQAMQGRIHHDKAQSVILLQAVQLGFLERQEDGRLL